MLMQTLVKEVPVSQSEGSSDLGRTRNCEHISAFSVGSQQALKK